MTVVELPVPVYGVPDRGLNNVLFPEPLIDTPPGAYGPPAPVLLPTAGYEGPPPPVRPKPFYGPPKQVYGPPKPIYGPPKPIYGPPKKNYGPPKQGPPKPLYGAPFKPFPPKFSGPKPIYGPPKPVYGPPKQNHGPPKPIYGPPISPSLPLPELPPIYGTPLHNLPLDLKPNFPIPTDTYGPPGHFLGPVGPNDQQIVLPDFGGNFHYGPPQPDPNPKPPHPGIPAPPTPPHVLYDGWKPIPGVSKPVIEHDVHQSLEQYGPPPPPSINLDFDHGAQGFLGTQISSGYSNVHHDILANIDLNAIIGGGEGDSNHIDQAKTIYEAHYTEPTGHNVIGSSSFIQGLTVPSAVEKPLDSYGAPPLDSFSTSGPYSSSIRQLSGKGLTPPSGIYGVPPGSQYGAPPRHPPSNLPLAYGVPSGSTGGHSFHTGGSAPKHPIKFRQPVPVGLIQDIGVSVNQKDIHGLDHGSQAPTYLPPPVRQVKDVNHHTGNHGMTFSIEPSNLYSLPHSGSPVNFQSAPGNLYGSPVDSYSAPFLTVADHSVSASNLNSITSTIDGGFLSNLDAAAILKHCPYHEAIIKAAQLGDKIPPELASSYVASLSSLGSSLSKNQQTLVSPNNAFNTPVPGSESVNYNSKDLATASHTLVQTILPADKPSKKEKTQKGKSIKTDSGKKQVYNDSDKLQVQIQETSQKIKNLSDEAKHLQQKIVATSQNIQQVNGKLSGAQIGGEIPVKGKHGTYTLQIQSADDNGRKGNRIEPSIPHDQLLNEGLLQSILQAIEQPQAPAVHRQPIPIHPINKPQQHSTMLDFGNIDAGGLVLPAGYEPVDRTKVEQKMTQQRQTLEREIQKVQRQKSTIDQEIQSTQHNIHHLLHTETSHEHRGDIPLTECDMRAENSIRHTYVVPAPRVDNVTPVPDVDVNDIAVYFNDRKDEESDDKHEETVTEISVATSISEKEERKNAQQYGSKKDFGDKVDNKKS